MKKLFKDVMEEHLGREKYERSSDIDINHRNGYSSKTISSSFGEVGLEVPRDRKSKFEPKVVKKYETVCNELDKKIIGLYACGMSVRDDNKIVSKSAYICMALDMEWKKDLLGIWIGESEGAKFWLSVCNDLKNRGLEDILIACMDGLKGLPEAIKIVYPNVNIQTCIVHQIRNSFKYIYSIFMSFFFIFPIIIIFIYIII